MYVRFAKSFIKDRKKAPAKIKEVFAKRLQIFQQNPNHPQLHNHSLIGEYLGFRSINITGDWRAIYSEEFNEEGKQIIVFKLLRTHSQLYG